MDVLELTELMNRVPRVTIRPDSAVASAKLRGIVASLSPEVEYFYVRYEGPFGSRFTGFELLDVCEEGEYSLIEATEQCRDLFRIPPIFITISTLLGNAVLMLNTETNKVYCVDFEGGVERLLGNCLEPLCDFGAYVRHFFLGVGLAG